MAGGQKSSRTKVVLDTNIFVSGLHWRGASYEILQLWINGDIEVVISPEIIEEVLRVLDIFRKPLPSSQRALIERMLWCKSTIVEPTVRLSAVRADPDDDKFLEAALAGEVSYIVSQDKHLLDLGGYEDVLILSPASFLERF